MPEYFQKDALIHFLPYFMRLRKEQDRQCQGIDSWIHHAICAVSRANVIIDLMKTFACFSFSKIYRFAIVI